MQLGEREEDLDALNHHITEAIKLMRWVGFTKPIPALEDARSGVQERLRREWRRQQESKA